MGIKHDVNENFFNKWSSPMAYVLGYFYADGHLIDSGNIRAYYVVVTSVDKVTIERIKNLMSSKHKIQVLPPRTKNSKTRYLLRIGDRKLYDSLINLGLYPNKSLNINFPAVPKKYISDFTRGYLDGDGCVYVATRKGITQDRVLKRLSVIFTSGSKEFLEGLRVALSRGATLENKGNIYNSKRSFQLVYSTGSSMKLFVFFYHNVSSELYLKRKVDKFLEYFSMRKKIVDRKVQNVIEYLN